MTGDCRWRGWDDVREGYECGADALKHAVYFLFLLSMHLLLDLKRP